MCLFLKLTIITLVNAYLTRIISLLLKLIPQDKDIKLKGAEIILLEKELSTISMINEFAKHVKLQRRINKLKDEKKNLMKSEAFRIMKIRYLIMVVMYIFVTGALVILTWIHRNETIVKVPPKWLWPISTVFDWTNFVPGYITVPCWVVISSKATKIISNNF